MKVKIRSIYREVLAATGRVWDAKGEPHLQFRQFQPPPIGKQNGMPRYAAYGEAWMTPAEAKFLVESKENKQAAEMGYELPYFYPLGHPVPALDNAEGHVLTPPLTDKTAHLTDSRQMEAAQAINAERDAAMARHAALAAPEVPVPDEDTPEAKKARTRAAIRARLEANEGLTPAAGPPA